MAERTPALRVRGSKKLRMGGWLSALWAVLTTPIPPFAAYDLKVVLKLSSGQIMLFEGVRYLGMIVHEP